MVIRAYIYIDTWDTNCGVGA